MKKTGLLLSICLALVLISAFALSAGAVQRGDVDFDGKVTSYDARLALRRAVGLETYMPGSSAFIHCDMNCDGKVTADDARHILRTAVELEQPIEADVFPIPRTITDTDSAFIQIVDVYLEAYYDQTVLVISIKNKSDKNLLSAEIDMPAINGIVFNDFTAYDYIQPGQTVYGELWCGQYCTPENILNGDAPEMIFQVWYAAFDPVTGEVKDYYDEDIYINPLNIDPENVFYDAYAVDWSQPYYQDENILLSYAGADQYVVEGVTFKNIYFILKNYTDEKLFYGIDDIYLNGKPVDYYINGGLYPGTQTMIAITVSPYLFSEPSFEEITKVEYSIRVREYYNYQDLLYSDDWYTYW